MRKRLREAPRRPRSRRMSRFVRPKIKRIEIRWREARKAASLVYRPRIRKIAIRISSEPIRRTVVSGGIGRDLTSCRDFVVFA